MEKTNLTPNYDWNFVKKLMEEHGCKTLDELMHKESTFDDVEFLKKLNSPEFSLKMKDINLNFTNE